MVQRLRPLLAVAVVLGALGTGAAAASAHPLLVTSAPTAGSIDPDSPSSVALAFSEAAVPSGSALTVTGPHGRVRLGALTASDGGQQLTAKVPSSLRPGVYKAHWVALGDDGHTVSGSFAFGVAEHSGAPPPGAAASLGAVGETGRGGSGSGQGVVSTAMLWLGVLAASLLWGGWLLVAVLRRRRIPLEGGVELLRRVGAWVLVVAVASAIYGVVADARAGAGGGFDLGLLTASGTALSAVVRLGVAFIGGLVVFGLLRRGRADRGLLVSGVVGGCLLASFGVSGHVLAEGSTLAAVGMAVHVLAAGTWAGGLIALLLLSWRGAVPLGPAARAFAPVAVTGIGVAGVTGAIAAIREVGHWYFLWWSGYGRLVIVQALVVVLATGLGALGAWRARRRIMAVETGLVVAVVAIATVLGGLAQGRGQPLPSQRGDLLAGPAISTMLVHSGPVPVTVAPARPGMNRIVVAVHHDARSVIVRMVCGCDQRPVISAAESRPGCARDVLRQRPHPHRRHMERLPDAGRQPVAFAGCAPGRRRGGAGCAGAQCPGGGRPERARCRPVPAVPDRS